MFLSKSNYPEITLQEKEIKSKTKIILEHTLITATTSNVDNDNINITNIIISDDLSKSKMNNEDSYISKPLSSPKTMPQQHLKDNNHNHRNTNNNNNNNLTTPNNNNKNDKKYGSFEDSCSRLSISEIGGSLMLIGKALDTTKTFQNITTGVRGVLVVAVVLVIVIVAKLVVVIIVVVVY